MTIADTGGTRRKDQAGEELARITLNASPTLHRAVKRRALDLDMTMTEYVTALILADLEDGREVNSS